MKTIPESEYTGPVYVQVGHDGRYFRDIAQLREDGVPLPEFVEACDTKTFTLPDVADLVEHELNHGEYHDGCDPVTEDAELQAAIDAYNARQTDETWTPNGILVRLSKLEPS